VWVICGKCSRWNLTPFEERWEALEQAERLYHGTRARVSTDNIALAQVADGTELVRIGRPLRPEFAAWRFGKELRRRARRYWSSPLAAAEVMFLGVASAYAVYVLRFATGATPYTSAPALSATALVLSAQLSMTAVLRNRYRRFRIAVRSMVPSGEAGPSALTAANLASIRLDFDRDGSLLAELESRTPRVSGTIRRRLIGPLHVSLEEAPTRTNFAGDAALSMVRSALTTMHEGGASRGDVRAMLDLMDRHDARHPLELLRPVASRFRSRDRFGFELGLVDAPRRLAVEMLLAEDDERRLMQGELAELYGRWEEAERVARIADTLLADSGEER
jgi:hypothetical protein